MSAHSTAASRSTFASIRSASRCIASARPAAPSAAQPGNASAAAETARSASCSPPRATSASGRASIGLRSTNVAPLPTRSPPMKCSVETSTPATSVRLIREPAERDRRDVDRRVAAVDRQHRAVDVGGLVGEEPRDRRRHLVRRRRSAQRDVHEAGLVRRVAVRPEPLAERGHLPVGHRRPHPARRDAVRAHALGAVVDREALGQHLQARLGGAVRERLGHARRPAADDTVTIAPVAPSGARSPRAPSGRRR